MQGVSSGRLDPLKASVVSVWVVSLWVQPRRREALSETIKVLVCLHKEGASVEEALV